MPDPTPNEAKPKPGCDEHPDERELGDPDESETYGGCAACWDIERAEEAEEREDVIAGLISRLAEAEKRQGVVCHPHEHTEHCEQITTLNTRLAEAERRVRHGFRRESQLRAALQKMHAGHGCEGRDCWVRAAYDESLKENERAALAPAAKDEARHVDCLKDPCGTCEGHEEVSLALGFARGIEEAAKVAKAAAEEFASPQGKTAATIVEQRIRALAAPKATEASEDGATWGPPPCTDHDFSEEDSEGRTCWKCGTRDPKATEAKAGPFVVPKQEEKPDPDDEAFRLWVTDPRISPYLTDEERAEAKRRLKPAAEEGKATEPRCSCGHPASKHGKDLGGCSVCSCLVNHNDDRDAFPGELGCEEKLEGWCCTRPGNHDGEHVARSNRGQVHARRSAPKPDAGEAREPFPDLDAYEKKTRERGHLSLHRALALIPEARYLRMAVGKGGPSAALCAALSENERLKAELAEAKDEVAATMNDLNVADCEHRETKRALDAAQKEAARYREALETGLREMEAAGAGGWAAAVTLRAALEAKP